MRKKLLSALLSMCMMLTMLPMSAFAADETELNLGDGKWGTSGDAYTYTLEADTEVKIVDAKDGTYTLDLDTKALKVNSFDVAVGSTLELKAKENSEAGVYKLDNDVIAFNLGGYVTINKEVIFRDPVTVAKMDSPAPKAKSVETNTISGEFKDGLTIKSGVEATIKDADVTGDIIVEKDAKLTVGNDVVLAEDSEVQVAGELVYDTASNFKLDKVVTKDGGTVSMTGTTVDYKFTITNSGTVSVYYMANDTDTYVLAADVSADGIVKLPTTGKTKLEFSKTVDTLKIDGDLVTSDIDTKDNTYKLTNDTKAHTIDVEFHRSSGGGGGGSSGYSVNVASTTNGTVTVSPKNASKGATVTVTAKPDKGYVLDTLTVTDKDGKKIDLTDKGDNKFTFVMPAGSVTVKATFKVAPKTPFTDVAESAWYADAVAYVYENGMMKGTSDTKFSPEQTTTRGMIVTILYRLEKEPSASAASFTDVASGKYYSKAVAWASANKIVTGYGDGKFGPNDTITREQMAAILYRYASYKGYDVTKTADLSKFTDASQVGVFAKAAMQWANAEGLINGTSTTKLSPKSGATRAEVATILMRFCENIAK